MAIAEKIDDQVALVLSLEEATLMRHIYASVGTPLGEDRKLVESIFNALMKAGVEYASEGESDWLEWHGKYILGSIRLKKGITESLEKIISPVEEESEDDDIPF